MFHTERANRGPSPGAKGEVLGTRLVRAGARNNPLSSDVLLNFCYRVIVCAFCFAFFFLFFLSLFVYFQSKNFYL